MACVNSYSFVFLSRVRVLAYEMIESRKDIHERKLVTESSEQVSDRDMDILTRE